MARRVVQALIVLFGISLFVFVLLRISGDPAAVLLPLDASPEQREAVRRAFGLDDPLPMQFLLFLLNVARGNFGVSYSTRRPAMEEVLTQLPATVELALAATVLTAIVGISLGVVTAVRKGSIVDQAVTNVALTTQALPGFWVGTMLILLFAVILGWLPTSGRGGIANLVLPVSTLTLSFAPQILVLVRTSMLEELSEQYLQTARAKGLRERHVLYGHALRNVLIPVITVIGLHFGQLLGGAIITEAVFAWPGVGLTVLRAVSRGDFPVVQSAVLVLSLGVILVNLVVDLLYSWADPRIRLS
jgi:peptide/nickel transport system permease protein